MLFSFQMLELSSVFPVIFVRVCVCVCTLLLSHWWVSVGRGNKYKFKYLCLNGSHSSIAYDSKKNWKQPKHPPTGIKHSRSTQWNTTQMYNIVLHRGRLVWWLRTQILTLTSCVTSGELLYLPTQFPHL